MTRNKAKRPNTKHGKRKSAQGRKKTSEPNQEAPTPLRLVRDVEDPPDEPTPADTDELKQVLSRTIESLGIDSSDLLDHPSELLDELFVPSEFAARELDDGLTQPAKAAELMQAAAEEDDPVKAARLATEAVELDPECLQNLLGAALAGAESEEERIELARIGVGIGEMSLGEEYFERERGRFWLLPETQPYMETLMLLAESLREAGHLEEALETYELMLELNPGDNQGAREPALACALERGDLESAVGLLERYELDDSAVFWWSRVLERFLSGDEARASNYLDEARRHNQFVEPYLTGKKRLPRNLPAMYTPGGLSEAKYVAVTLRPSWRRHRKAVTWLKNQA